MSDNSNNDKPDRLLSCHTCLSVAVTDMLSYSDYEFICVMLLQQSIPVECDHCTHTAKWFVYSEEFPNSIMKG